MKELKNEEMKEWRMCGEENQFKIQGMVEVLSKMAKGC
jgi:hypothetical protein